MLKILDEEWSWTNMTLWDYLFEGNWPKKWKKFFTREDVQKELVYISDEIIKESKGCIIYPSPNRVFRAFSLDPQKIKVIILGQDPYHNGNAVGLCFSIPPGKKINPSLLNIYKELENEGYKPDKTGSLVHWHEQGCLLINTALTVIKGNAETHVHIWADFTEKLIHYLSTSRKNIAWVLMGAKALSYNRDIDKTNGHKSFITSHPSPLSAYRGFGKGMKYPAFMDSGLFKDVNNFLDENGKKKVKW